MGRGYISFEDIEKIVGRENMICFCELMKEKFEQTDEKKRIKIAFIEHLLYEDYEYQFENGGEIPKTFDNLLILRQCIDTEIKLQNGGSLQQENDRCALIGVSSKETTSTG